jgi:hypothetical protein
VVVGLSPTTKSIRDILLICIFVVGEHTHTTFHLHVDKKLCLC